MTTAQPLAMVKAWMGSGPEAKRKAEVRSVEHRSYLIAGGWVRSVDYKIIPYSR